MIAHIRGRLSAKQNTEVVIDCHGVGYLINVPLTTAERLPELHTEVTLLTLLVVREDSMDLFGFTDAADRSAFVLLTSIPGIGPKIALGILSSIRLADLQQVIIQQDIRSLQKLPGVGKKTAERIVVELRDKLSKDTLTPTPDSEIGKAQTETDVRQESLSALLALGYSRPIADKAIREVIVSERDMKLSVEQVIRKALRNVMK